VGRGSVRVSPAGPAGLLADAAPWSCATRVNASATEAQTATIEATIESWARVRVDTCDLRRVAAVVPQRDVETCWADAVRQVEPVYPDSRPLGVEPAVPNAHAVAPCANGEPDCIGSQRISTACPCVDDIVLPAAVRRSTHEARPNPSSTIPRRTAAARGSRWTSQCMSPGPARCASPRLGSCDHATALIHGVR
jgi:hypothetical protein